MGNLRFTFSTVGIKQVDTIFKDVNERANDLSIPFEQIKNDFYNLEEEVFANQGNFEGLQEWAQLSPEYEKRKSILHPGAGKLEVSGALRKSFKEGEDGNVTRVSPTLLEMGSSLKTPDGKYNLALLHQTGTSKMPKRLPVRIPEGRKNKWRRFIRNHVIDPKAPIGGK